MRTLEEEISSGMIEWGLGAAFWKIGDDTYKLYDTKRMLTKMPLCAKSVLLSISQW